MDAVAGVPTNPIVAHGNGRTMMRIVAYTVGVVLLAAAGFAVLLHSLPPLQADQAQGLTDGALRGIFAKTIGVMFFAGIMGGCLYNCRGLSKHSAAGDYHSNYDLSYYLRPLAGGISGLIVFFLLLGGAMTLNVEGAKGIAWASLLGRMPYIAFALLAGYGSHEFMLKLKDLADSLFALRNGEGGG